jgi:hypothetical protein
MLSRALTAPVPRVVSIVRGCEYPLPGSVCMLRSDSVYSAVCPLATRSR